jgi:hypothetical protein
MEANNVKQNLRDKTENQSETKKHTSKRGGFQIWESPELTPPAVFEEIQDVDPSLIGKTFEFSALAQQFGHETAQGKISDLVKASASGTSSTVLLWQEPPGGMSLVHVWFGANFPLFRHSHPAYGDCLYYVINGELIMGERHLKAGGGMFVPNGHPYRFTAGPAGVELLEFRAGGGIKGAPGLKMEERSLDAIQKLIDQHHVQRPHWKQPKKIGDTAFIQQELDFGSE